MKGLNWRPDMDAAEYHKHPPEFTQFLHGVGGPYTGPLYNGYLVGLVSRLARFCPSALDRVFMYVCVCGEGEGGRLSYGAERIRKWFPSPLIDWMCVRYECEYFSRYRIKPVRWAFFHFLQVPYDPKTGWTLASPPGHRWTGFVFGLLRVHWRRNQCGYASRHMCESCMELMSICCALRATSRFVRNCVDAVLRGNEPRALYFYAKLYGFEPAFDTPYPCIVVVHRNAYHGFVYHPVELTWGYLRKINSKLCSY